MSSNQPQVRVTTTDVQAARDQLAQDRAAGVRSPERVHRIADLELPHEPLAAY